jgi:membrane-bound lytic murein transglycosylase MltF
MWHGGWGIQYPHFLATDGFDMTTTWKRTTVHSAPVALVLVFLLICVPSWACSESNGTAEQEETPPELQIPATNVEDPGPDIAWGLEGDFSRQVLEPFTGDFDAMVERRIIRALVVPSPTFYFLDGAEQKGIAYEALKEFEKLVNERLGTGHLPVYVVIVPVRRDQIIPGLVNGVGDLAVANLTISPRRLEQVDFSDPVFTGVDQILVTGPSAPPVSSLEDLSGQTIYLRQSTTYYENLERLSLSLRALGKPEIDLQPAPEYLEDEDFLELVDNGVIPWTIVDSHIAEFWDQVFENITVRPDIAIDSDGSIGWAFRQDSPQFAAILNEYVKDYKKGTLFGNVLFNRYLKNTKYVLNPLADEELRRFEETIEFFRQYGDQYDFDSLMVAAQGYQESRLDQSVRSGAGAIGIMQLLPSTAADPNVGITDIHEVESNIHAGVKYLRFIRDRYFSDPEMDEANQAFFSFAAYNAGPARVAQLRRKAEEAGLDPNEWFNNVEIIAAQVIGRETVQYVSNIAKYYLAYSAVVPLIEAKMQSEQQRKDGQ